MANTPKETIYNQVAYVTLHDGALAAASGGGFSPKLTTDLSVANCESRPNGSMKATLTFSVAPTTGSVGVHFRFTGIDGANDEPALDADFDGHFRGSLPLDLDGATTVHYILLEECKCPKPLETAEVYLKNNANQALASAKIQWSSDSFLPAP